MQLGGVVCGGGTHFLPILLQPDWLLLCLLLFTLYQKCLIHPFIHTFTDSLLPTSKVWGCLGLGEASCKEYQKNPVLCPHIQSSNISLPCRETVCLARKPVYQLPGIRCRSLKTHTALSLTTGSSTGRPEDAGKGTATVWHQGVPPTGLVILIKTVQIDRGNKSESTAQLQLLHVPAYASRLASRVCQRQLLAKA